MKDDGGFTWAIARPGQPPTTIAGDTTLADAVLTLNGKDGKNGALAGQIAYEIGRVVKSIEDLGIADNTLIIYIWSDNGSSMEGTETGSFNEMITLKRRRLPELRGQDTVPIHGPDRPGRLRRRAIRHEEMTRTRPGDELDVSF
jgi:Sulfatase